MSTITRMALKLGSWNKLIPCDWDDLAASEFRIYYPWSNPTFNVYVSFTYRDIAEETERALVRTFEMGMIAAKKEFRRFLGINS